MTIISLNNNFCNNYNLWLLPYPRDPADGLSWLVEELQKAEESGSKVYIISHIPPGIPNCLVSWSHQYTRIVTRYSNIIMGQFYGHTHYDEFSVLYNTEGEPISVAFIAPSITPHDYLNPGYRIYLTDGAREKSTHVVLDHQTYYVDLEHENKVDQNATLNYTLEYSAKSDLGMEDMSPLSWSQYVNDLVVNKDEWSKFYKRYTRYGPYSSQHPCDETCKENILCRLLTFDSSELQMCHALKELIMEDVNSNELDNDWWNEDFEDF